MRKSTAKISTLVAVSGGLVALPVAALELGEAQVRSSIGQPLRASIAYALGPNEMLTSTCVSLQRRLPRDSDMPIVGPATVSIGDGFIEIAGKSVVQEPLVTMRVNVNCPYTAKLSREYILFLDPAGTIKQQSETVASTSVSQRAGTRATVTRQRRQLSGGPIGIGTRYRVRDGDSVSRIVERIVNRPVDHWPAIFAVLNANPAAFIDNDPNRIITGSWLTIPDFGATAPLAAAAPVTDTTSVVPLAVATPAPAAAPAAPRRQQISSEPIGIATRYRVQKGDSVSGIAERIENRPGAHWPAVMAIFDANPDAFINNDPDMLIIGSWLSIPDFGVDVPLMVADRNILTGKGPSTAYPGVTVGQVTEQTNSEPVVSEPVVSEPVVSEPVVSEPIFSDNAYAFTSEPDGDSSIIIPDTQLESPEVTSASPNVPTATIQATPADSSSTNWLAWLGGAGLALIAGMLYLGRRARGRFASSPIGVVVAPPQRRRSDDDTQAIEAISKTVEPGSYDDAVENSYDASIDDPTEENLVLDADLIIGTGLQTGRDVDVAQDFGFAATTALDMELPEEMSSGTEESLQTHIIPPINIELESILESEVLPDDDYDMSVIIDATKMPNTDDVTQRDLEAVPIETSDTALITGSYTVSHEVDYQILEQDYEDEFTATQLLNNEIARAAVALTDHMDAKKTGASDDDDTSKMPLASVTALDATPKASVDGDDDIGDLDDTGINEELTVNMLEAEGTIDMVADEVTVEVPVPKKGKTG